MGLLDVYFTRVRSFSCCCCRCFGAFTVGSAIVHRRETVPASAALEAYKLETAGEVAKATSVGSPLAKNRDTRGAILMRHTRYHLMAAATVCGVTGRF